MAKQAPLAERVISAFGGLTKAAKALGIPITTVDGWRANGSIPRWRIEAIRKAAEENGVRLPSDFAKRAA